ncbi:MAG: energy-coupling factor ABC transporter ATP-binding protein [Planctomycetota bacterium]|jgi:cobalt/nickel transport system ATP-binding protein|nr:energy-coupling factor ABC transporter ATP-binding protein [Planctomycetota bacterium]
MDRPSIFTLEHITFAYPERPVLFQDLGFSLREGEHIGLHGPNGCGKTTFLRLVMGLETPQSGRILYQGELVDNGAALHRMRCGIGFVMQNSDDQLFSATVLEDVAFGPFNLGLKRRQAKDRAMETLERMELENLADRATHRLSAGEKKMVSIASMLSMRPHALLLDEPTSSLDDNARNRIIGILQKEVQARIIVSHDKNVLGQTASTFIRINGSGGIDALPSAFSQVVGCHEARLVRDGATRSKLCR